MRHKPPLQNSSYQYFVCWVFFTNHWRIFYYYKQKYNILYAKFTQQPLITNDGSSKIDDYEKNT